MVTGDCLCAIDEPDLLEERHLTFYRPRRMMANNWALETCCGNIGRTVGVGQFLTGGLLLEVVLVWRHFEGQTEYAELTLARFIADLPASNARSRINRCRCPLRYQRHPHAKIRPRLEDLVRSLVRQPVGRRT